MAFLLGGGSFAGTLRHDPQVWHRLAFSAQPGKGPGWGFPGCSGTDPGGIQLGRIPIGGIIWYFRSIR